MDCYGISLICIAAVFGGSLSLAGQLLNQIWRQKKLMLWVVFPILSLVGCYWLMHYVGQLIVRNP